MRPVLAALLLALLAACANDGGVESSPAEVAAASFTTEGPRTLTLFTMISNRTGSGGHTALMIDGSQRVIFDPAGSFRDPRAAERGDVIYGVTPAWLQAYRSAHARSAYHVVSQRIVVTPEQAEQALRLAQSNGSVMAAHCANATSRLLAQVPGFTHVDRTYYPVKLMTQFGTIQGVETTRYYEDDAGNVIDALKAAQATQ